MQNQNMKVIGVLLFLSITLGVVSQTQIVIKPTSLDTLINYENTIESISKGFQYFNPYHDEDFEDAYEQWPNVLNKPLIYKRTNDDFYPTLHAWYFYDKDSTVKWIYYRWGFGNTKVLASDHEITRQTLRKEDFKNKYQIEKEYLKSILGKPTIENEKEETDSYLSLKTIWDLSEKRIVINMLVDKEVIEFEVKETGKTIKIPRSKIEIRVLTKEK